MLWRPSTPISNKHFNIVFFNFRIDLVWSTLKNMSEGGALWVVLSRILLEPMSVGTL
jgi:hypothetical protein